MVVSPPTPCNAIEDALAPLGVRIHQQHLPPSRLVDLIEAAARYRGSHGGPRTWLYGIARNVIAAEFRRSAREQRAERLIAGRRLLDADDVERLTERIDALRQVRKLHEALQALPEGERAVLELVAVDGLTVAEAAAALRIRQVAARVRLHRARKALLPAPVPPALAEEVMS